VKETNTIIVGASFSGLASDIWAHGLHRFSQIAQSVFILAAGGRAGCSETSEKH